MENAENAELISDRACGDCTLCCKVMSIGDNEKPQGKWCPECNIGVGCKIYDRKPSECTNFYCGYLFLPFLGEHWFPNKCKMIATVELDGSRIALHVDPSRSDIWKKEPFYSEIKEWSREAAQHMHQVVVQIGARAIVVLPDKDVDLGIIQDDERIITIERKNMFGRSLEAFKLKADDPMLSGAPIGKPYQFSK